MMTLAAFILGVVVGVRLLPRPRCRGCGKVPAVCEFCIRNTKGDETR